MSNVTIKREYKTDQNKLIDLWIEADSHIIAIENKLYGSPTNPFADYSSFIKKKSEGRDIFMFYLSLFPPSQDIDLYGFIPVTYKNFLSNVRKKLGEYVINVPNTSQLREMDFCGTRTGKEVDKWKELNLTKEKGSKVIVPLIKEFPINIECKVIKKIELGTHVIYLGEVLIVHVDENMLKDDKLDPLKQNQIVYTARNYYGLIKEPLEKHGFSLKS